MKTLVTGFLVFSTLTPMALGQVRHLTLISTNTVTISASEIAEVPYMSGISLSYDPAVLVQWPNGSWDYADIQAGLHPIIVGPATLGLDSPYTRFATIKITPTNAISPSINITNLVENFVTNVVTTLITNVVTVTNSISITNAPQPFPPDKTLIIPAGTGGVLVTMESSPDLINWSTATNGFYPNTNVNMFFRIRADRAP